MQLPLFKYHPDPIATGSIERSDETCKLCAKSRGFIYKGPLYATDEVEAQICPWCIADGTAHKVLDATFVDPDGVGGYGDWDVIPDAVTEEVAYRTPGFTGWQQEMWFTHCGDAAEFLGPVGQAELEQWGTDAIAAISQESGLQGKELEDYIRSLNRVGGPTAYLFRCLQCKLFGGYSDCH